MVDDLHSLVGRQLTGVSTLSAPDGSAPFRIADVIGVDQFALGERSDLVLAVQPPGTFRGDSGILWLTEEGIAAAIHCRGQIMSGLEGSRLTTSMSAKRVSNSLGVQLAMG